MARLPARPDGSAYPDPAADGYEVIAVQNPLESLAGDVETTKRMVDTQTCPSVLVGHSYGRAVITGSRPEIQKREALVFSNTHIPAFIV